MYNSDKPHSFLKLSFPFADKILFEDLSKILDSKVIDHILQQTGRVEERKRKLPARTIVLLIIGMSLYAKVSILEVLNIMVEGLRVHGAYLLNGGYYNPQGRRKLGG